MSSLVAFNAYGDPPHLHSFPTRRSSDLPQLRHRGPDVRGRQAGEQLFECVRVRRLDLDELARSEEHTSELQSLRHLVCRLLLEKKKTGMGNSSTNGKRKPLVRTSRTQTE